MFDAQQLVDVLGSSPETDFVRLAADWIQRATKDENRNLLAEPHLSGDAVIDALVAAATEHVALRTGSQIPSWVAGPSRRLETFWYPGFDALFANALAHTPVSFSHRGLFVEADSLMSV